MSRDDLSPLGHRTGRYKYNKKESLIDCSTSPSIMHTAVFVLRLVHVRNPEIARINWPKWIMWTTWLHYEQKLGQILRNNHSWGRRMFLIPRLRRSERSRVRFE